MLGSSGSLSAKGLEGGGTGGIGGGPDPPEGCVAGGCTLEGLEEVLDYPWPDKPLVEDQ